MESTLHADNRVTVIAPRVTVWSRATHRRDLTVYEDTSNRLACLADAPKMKLNKARRRTTRISRRRRKSNRRSLRASRYLNRTSKPYNMDGSQAAVKASATTGASEETLDGAPDPAVGRRRHERNA